MANNIITSRMQQRRDTATNWTATNPILLAGEMGLETDTRKIKFGDGTTAWNSLGYAGGSYTLPIATASILGGIKIGSGLSIDGSGIVSVSGGSSLPLSGGTMTGRIIFNTTTNQNAAWRSTTGIIDQIIDTSASYHMIMSGRLSNNTLVYSLELLDSSSAPVMRLYAGTSYLEINSTSITTNNVFYNAAWNDYAEFYQSDKEYFPGLVVAPNEDGLMAMTTKRHQPGAKIVSDTYGMILGKKEGGTPVGLCGQVLAFTNDVHLRSGDCVCSGPSGTVTKMRWWEKIFFPDAIIGTVIRKFTTEYWDKRKVNGRILISLR